MIERANNTVQVGASNEKRKVQARGTLPKIALSIVIQGLNVPKISLIFGTFAFLMPIITATLKVFTIFALNYGNFSLINTIFRR